MKIAYHMAQRAAAHRRLWAVVYYGTRAIQTVVFIFQP